jgi:hypothetical protein
VSGEIDFESGTPIWSALVEHNTPGTDGVWNRVFNAENHDMAILKICILFQEDGLPPARITKLWLEELTFPEGGETNGE